MLRGSAPAVRTISATSLRVSPFRAMRTTAEKSLASRNCSGTTNPLTGSGDDCYRVLFHEGYSFSGRWGQRMLCGKRNDTLSGQSCMGRFTDNVHDLVRRGKKRHVVDGKRANRCVHARRHKTLRFRIDHPVFFCKQVPGELCSPGRRNNSLLNAPDRNRTLHRTAQSDLLGRSILRESLRKALIGHPDKAVRIWRKLRRLGMSFVPVENFRDLTSFHVNQ